MTDNVVRHLRRSARTGDDGVIVITHAHTDTGYRLAQRLLTIGQRVVVTGRTLSPLARTLHGHSSSDVMAIVADVDDADQWTRLIQLAEQRMGRIVGVLDGRRISGRSIPATVIY
ncbi:MULTISPECIES: SDR family NAD(P)-dependent oxidoreductase [Mycolicibacterium]|jgi:short-subunit dehydrogenase involved in D-alanine esterification of teichoic acids|uniref:Short-chain dehydrogenase/reductase SDR n=1 Tax=Mycolicibacterium vanbaalenii (strain DSM 7251 / JCM 13017 / BCRC 16820 / KCTC 9966 / NRRL B-24157 / PYR-1) TaxID=350058 RepID=A1T6T5_MYCVP|nr:MULTISPECIES: SDR family NAD(P)-dependent oxidoreductase [Mycolicibacterium]ABM12885.1 hypothetical protein Mvan_2070 [Mycolicibacterium vanbaalenii PYR-1]MCV7127959.1 SDR family NAD(P)-dependent oxidoreductase [Mycolicibacterium vanbaalenii PYR-1]MDW5610826.1 SDR family NAD(P)-dependent oxidoreductase [Mycolicibacterium sp. D5.8-2]